MAIRAQPEKGHRDSLSRLRSRGNISAEIASFLERSIRSGEYAAGERLPPERTLAERFRVSRTTVREALKFLENRRLIIRRRGAGTIVLAPDERVREVESILTQARHDLEDVAELRSVIEPDIARLAAARATGADLNTLQDIIEKSGAPLTAQGSLQLDMAFHLALARASENELLPALLAFANESTAEYRIDSHRTQRSRRISLEGHVEIFRRVAEHDAVGAEAAMRAHLTQVNELTREFRNPNPDSSITATETSCKPNSIIVQKGEDE